MRRSLITLGLLSATLLATTPALAQIEDTIPEERNFVSSENFIIELRVGPYVPDFGDAALNDAFDTFYGEDSSLAWELQLDVIAFNADDVFDVGLGALIGRVHYGGNTLEQSSLDSGAAVQTDEESTFRIIPMALMASIRIDALPRLLNVPFIFTGKLGYQWAHWVTEQGTADEESGISHGLRWAGQVALDLDVFEPSQARMMDEEWGINHSFLFFEYYGFVPRGDSLEIGARAWSAGLGFNF